MPIIYEISFIILILFISGSVLFKHYPESKRNYVPKPVEMVGKRAVVSGNIIYEGVGEIKCLLKNGNQFFSRAKSTSGGAIRAGKEVVICWIEDGIAYVAGINDEKEGPGLPINKKI